MKLEYKVLWFEDQFDEIEDDIARFQDLVREHGFIPIIQKRSSVTVEEIEEIAAQLDTYNPYDLIIFDYNLGSGNADGVSIAKSLRSKIYTDMIFYSGKVPDELRTLLYEEKIDGVFIIHRDNFFEDIQLLIEDHIKKMSDMNNVRGVVMSATSAMDTALRDILKGRLEGLDPDVSEQTLAKLKERLTDFYQGKLDQVSGLSSVDEAFADHFLTNFENVRITLKDLIAAEGELKKLIENNSVVHRVQIERNKLAHQREELTADGKMFLHGKTSKEYNFTEFVRVRNELLAAGRDIDKFTDS